MNRIEDSKNLIKRAIFTISELNKLESKLDNKPIYDAMEHKNPLNYKEAKQGKINIEEFKNAIYVLIEADDFLYKKAPMHNLNDQEAMEFCKLIFKSKKHLDNVLKEFGFKFQESPTLDERALYIVSNKKLLKNLKGKMPNINIISTEGVLNPEDMKIIRPNIPEKTLKGISKKCEITIKEINRLIDKLKPSEIIVIVDEKNKGDKLIYERAKELFNAKKISVEDINL